MYFPEPNGVVDYVLLGYVALGAVWGLRAGLIRSAASFGSVIAGWIAAIFATKPVLAFVDSRWQIHEALRGQLYSWLPASTFLDAGVLDLLASGLAGAVIFLLLFIAARWIVMAAAGALNLIFDRGPLYGINRLAGAVFGILRNALVAMVGIGLLTTWPVLPPLAWAAEAVNQSGYALLLQQAFHLISPLAPFSLPL